MGPRRPRTNLFLAAGTALFLSLVMSAPAFSLGLEKVEVIVPSGPDSGLAHPQGLWYDRLKGYLIVANTDLHQVLVLSPGGSVYKVLGKRGGLAFPLAVAANREGTLYIAERSSEHLKVVSRYDALAGEEYRSLDISPYRRSVPVQPSALYMDSTGRLYVADRGNRQVLVFDRNEKFLFAIPDVGEPTTVRTGRSGQILVADPAFGGIRVYSEQGNRLRTIGGYSSQFSEPLRVRAMAVDNSDRIWVAEEGGRGIRAIDLFGNLISSRAARGFGGEGVFAPVDMATDPQNNLYVLEQGGNRITVFRISEF